VKLKTKDMLQETIFNEMTRFVDSIRAEIRDENQDNIAIDFWLFKLDRRIKILKDYLERMSDKDDRND